MGPARGRRDLELRRGRGDRRHTTSPAGARPRFGSRVQMGINQGKGMAQPAAHGMAGLPVVVAWGYPNEVVGQGNHGARLPLCG